jgi:hypothetical protein
MRAPRNIVDRVFLERGAVLCRARAHTELDEGCSEEKEKRTSASFMAPPAAVSLCVGRAGDEVDGRRAAARSCVLRGRARTRGRATTEGREGERERVRERERLSLSLCAGKSGLEWCWWCRRVCVCTVAEDDDQVECVVLRGKREGSSSSKRAEEEEGDLCSSL